MTIIPISDEILNSLAKIFYEEIVNYFKDEEHQEEFTKWKAEEDAKTDSKNKKDRH